MRGVVAVVAGAVPGMLAGVVLWTAAATALLLAYWVGFEFLWVGLVCGTGKYGLGWFDPPAGPALAAVRDSSTLLTAVAFTWGEVFAGVLGAAFGGAAVAVVRGVAGRFRGARCRAKPLPVGSHEPRNSPAADSRRE